VLRKDSDEEGQLGPMPLTVQVRATIGITSRASERALFRNFDGKKRHPTEEDFPPGGEQLS
jgi:hypothetical protein